MLISSWVNGSKIDKVSIQDRGLNFGDGIFETMRIHGQNIPLIEYHFKRFIEGIDRLSLNLSEAEIHSLRQQCLSIASSQSSGTLKLTITRGNSERGYGYAKAIKPNIIIQLYELNDAKVDFASTGIELGICNIKLSHQPQLAGIKHLNRLEQVLAKGELAESGLSEGLMLDQNSHIVEGTYSNIFFMCEGKLLTPKLDNCGVKGTLREYLIDAAKEQGIQYSEEQIPLSILEKTQEVFICNSNLGIWPVIKIAEHDFKIGNMTGILQEKIAAELFPQ